MRCVYEHGMQARAPLKRTLVETPPQAAERLVSAAVVLIAAPRTPAEEPRPSAAIAATIERPVRVGEGTGLARRRGATGRKRR